MPQSPSPAIWQPILPMAYPSINVGATASSKAGSGTRFERAYTEPGDGANDESAEDREPAAREQHVHRVLQEFARMLEQVKQRARRRGRR